MSTELLPEPLSVSLPPIPGRIQLVAAVWVPGKGWLTCRPGFVTHGTRSRVEQAQLEVGSMVASIEHTAAKHDVDLDAVEKS
jgi:hypothetical protein